MPKVSATRRESSMPSMPQQEGFLRPDECKPKHIVMPITSKPSFLSNAAATDESTPPLIATTTLFIYWLPHKSPDKPHLKVYPVPDKLYSKAASGQLHFPMAAKLCPAF